LRSQAEQTELETLKALELATLEETLGAGPALALSMRRGLIARAPDSAPARFALARQLLQNGDAEGVAMMEAVVEQEPDAQPPGAELLRNYFSRRGDSTPAQQWHERYVTCSRVLAAAQRERTGFWLSDRIGPHQLSPEAFAILVAQLKAVPDVKRAYLVRKRVQHLPDKPAYVLGFASTPRWALSNRTRSRAALQGLRGRITLPGSVFIVNLEVSSSRFTSKLRRVEGSRVL
jgi:hypothetical protein